MKQLFLLTTLFLFVGVYTAQAQCQGAKAQATTAETKVCHKTAAAKAASLDPAIEKRECAESGKVSYYRKEVSQGGEATFTQVEYCTRSQRFVNVSPSAMAASNEAKSCCEKDCCKKSADKKGCHGDAKKTGNSGKTN